MKTKTSEHPSTRTNGNPWSNQPTSSVYNAGEIAKNQLLGINRVVALKIIIEGKIIKNFHHFSLKQYAAKHHSFQLTLPYDTLGSAENHELSESQQFLGKRLTVVISYKGVDDSPERTFVGVIMEVGYEQTQGSLGGIVLIGKSPTALLDAAPHVQSFGGDQPVKLNDIADRILKQGISKTKYDYRVDSNYKNNIRYSAQCNETHYNYLARMAEAYGEQFFYDGEVLHFGKLPPPQKPLQLTYGSNVSNINIKMRAVHVNPSFYDYNEVKNTKLTTGTSDIRHVSDIAKRAYQISKKALQTPSLRVAPIKSGTDMDVGESQKGRAGSGASEVFVTTGKTSLPFLYPGCAADIKMRKPDSNQTSYFTKLLIKDVTHEIDARGRYRGTFEAVAADSGFLPRPDFTEPIAEAQIATVISNTDPENKGRVQVRFDWQLHDTTAFIRVMTPDAGSSDKVSKNRGFMAIPEVGDQVMVGFEHNHPDRPFVMGGLFHGMVGAGGGSGNNIKSLSSKSGHTIELNDGGGMTIRDKNGNYVFLDGSGNITTEVSNNKTEKIGVDRTINVGSKNSILVGSKDGGAATAKFTMDSSGKVNITCDTEIKLETGESSLTMKKDGTITLKGKNVTIDSSDNATVKSNNVDIKGSGKAKANFNGNTTITGGQVDIN